MADAKTNRLRLVIRGAVQGVGFRPFVYKLASQMGLRGWVSNSSHGVLIEVDGLPEILTEFSARVQQEKPAISSIYSLEATYLDACGFENFEIRQSQDGEKTALVLPDIATCPDCLAEVSDPVNRRYRYPFTNCTNCGPRFTIIQALPYDRSRTSMKTFVMCEDCISEYHDPANRRFHAQPNACPACGPRLQLWNIDGSTVAVGHAALLKAANAIRVGKIVAVKGLGGFHLMVAAHNEDAVCRLRARKRREEKPFAMLFPKLELLGQHCFISPLEERVLKSPEAPIVLLKRRAKVNSLAPSIAPHNPYFGVMLPYTPLHHLLMQELGFPVVATSGNISEEPICTHEHEALSRLAGIADLFLIHDRPIVRHADDSIVREIDGREMVLRRARGFAPLPIPQKESLPPLVAVGAHQKNAIAASVGSQVFISQHIGDLETEASFKAFQGAIEAFTEIYDLQSAALACDMHPDYLSTQYAVGTGRDVIPVQHHYAHVLSCMAENELQPPVLGVAWDGSGFGLDGTVWGGEFLLVEDSHFTRAAHMRTFPLPGGEKAVKEPRRAALGILYELFGREAFAIGSPVRDAFTEDELRVLAGMLERNVNSPRTSSVGRLFDALASIANLRHVSKFEGQAAMELEYAITDGDEDSYTFRISSGKPIICDWEPMVRTLISQPNRPIGEVARKFHNTMTEAVVQIAEKTEQEKVVLTGGCFQNRYLTQSCIRRLKAAGFKVYWHQRVPPNDGGIALGQIVAAAAELKRREQE